MWNSIKKGFGYAFGGRIGWELGGLVWRWVSRLVMLAVLGIGAQCAGHNYTDGAAKAKAQQAQATPAKAHHQRQSKPKARQQEASQADTVPNPTVE